MSIRKRRWTNAKGEVQEKWMIHIKHTQADGTVHTLRRVSPVQTRRGADKFERQLREALLDGSLERKKKQVSKPQSKDRAVPTLAEFVPDFMAFQASPSASRRGANKPGELWHKRLMFDKHLLPVFGSVRLDAICVRSIDRYVGKKSETHSPKTIANHLVLLKRVFTVAKRWRLVSEVPQFSIPQPDPGRVDHDQFLNFEEAAHFLSGADEEDVLYVALLLRTGLRLGEARALRWSDIDLDEEALHVRRSFTKMGMGTPKSSRGHRRVPLAPDLLALLSRAARGRGLVFPGEGGEPRTLHHASHPVEKASRRAGLHLQSGEAKRVHPHMLRHTFISHCVMRGIPLPVVQRWAGHADLHSTMRYTHLAPEQEAEFITRIGGTGSQAGAQWEHKESKKKKNGH